MSGTCIATAEVGQTAGREIASIHDYIDNEAFPECFAGDAGPAQRSINQPLRLFAAVLATCES
jgi:hypothetical protein